MKKDADGMPKLDIKGLPTFTDEHGFTYTIERVMDEKVKFDPAFNVRPVSEYETDKWGAEDLVPKLRATRGVPKTRPAFHLDTDTGELTILRGNRRWIARSILRAQDPKDSNYQFIEAHIYRDLTPEQRARLKMDHAASELKLSKLGLYNSVVECKDIGLSEKDTISFLRGALNDSHSADKNPGKPNDSDEVFGQYRGVIQNYRRANDINVVEEALVKRLKDPSISFPSQRVIGECHTAWLEDRKENKMLGKIVTPETAPKFFEAWNKASEAASDAAAKGGKKAKATSAYNGQQIKGLAVKSVIMIAMKEALLRNAKNPKTIMDVLDPLCLKLEQFLSDEDRDQVQVAVTGKAKTRKVEASAPVKKTTEKVGAKK